MKKKYHTPTIVVEHYELTQAIASCATKINLLNSTCVLSDSDSTKKMKDLAGIGFFLDGCIMSAVGMDSDDSVCYHTNASAAFNS